MVADADVPQVEPLPDAIDPAVEPDAGSCPHGDGAPVAPLDVTEPSHPAEIAEMPADPATGPDEPTASEPTVIEPGRTQDLLSVTGPLLWQVTTEPNPFHRRLIVTTADAALLDLSLDPLLLRDLIEALSLVHDAQRAALGVTAASLTVGDQGENTPITPITPDGPPADSSAHVTPHRALEVDDLGADADGVDSDTLAADDPDSHVQPDDESATRDSRPVPNPETSVASVNPLAFEWWWSHKLLAFLLIFAAVFFVVGTVTSPR